MIYTVEQIKKDIKDLPEREVYTKYIVRSDNWYFENYMNLEMQDVLEYIDTYRLIVSKGFGISLNSVMMVGSGKLGFSMSPSNPQKPETSKLFLPFNDDENVRKVSDIDIAIISNEIFHKFWKLFRNSYKNQFQNTYQHLYQELYRGYINERNIIEVDGCRKEWNKMAINSKKRLRSDLYFKHEIAYRIYRSWEDFEDYNLQNFKKIKREDF